MSLLSSYLARLLYAGKLFSSKTFKCGLLFKPSARLRCLSILRVTILSSIYQAVLKIWIAEVDYTCFFGWGFHVSALFSRCPSRNVPRRAMLHRPHPTSLNCCRRSADGDVYMAAFVAGETSSVPSSCDGPLMLTRCNKPKTSSESFVPRVSSLP